MPKGPPKGEKDPQNVIGCAVHVMHIATDEIDEEMSSPGDISRAQAGARQGAISSLAVGALRLRRK